MEHFAPHAGVAFEGYYNKFHLPSGAYLAIIISTVSKAKHRPYTLSFTYVPKDGEIFQQELDVEKIDLIRDGPGHAFELKVHGIGYMRTVANSITDYKLDHPEFSFSAKTSSHTPWSPSKSTPEGWLVYLPLPLHWHVQSLNSHCQFTMSVPSINDQIPDRDRSGTAALHQEKNWAVSFPSAHIWIQAARPDSENYICLAGGQILGLEAFLIGYRSPKRKLDFVPPFALKCLGFSPTFSVSHSWERRTIELCVVGLWTKLTVKAEAPEGSFFQLSSPLKGGHRKNELAESFKATIEVEVHERSGWLGFGEWVLVEHEVFDGGAVEFGGGYYNARDGAKTEQIGKKEL